MSYWLCDYDFYYNETKIFTFKRSDYLLFSILKLENNKGELLIKGRISPWVGFKSLKILEQRLDSNISFTKRDKLYYLTTLFNNSDLSVSIIPKSGLAIKFKGDFIVNEVIVGDVKGIIKGLKTIYYFNFTNMSTELINYCIIYFAFRYYDIDDVA